MNAFQKVCNYAAVIGQHNIQHGYKNHHRYKIRNVNRGLHRPLPLIAFYLIDHHGENDRGRKSHKYTDRRNYKGIFQSGKKHGTGKILCKVFHSHKLSPGNSGRKAVFPECQLHSVHRYIAEYKHIDNGGKKHYPQLIILFPVFVRPFHSVPLLLQGPPKSGGPAEIICSDIHQMPPAGFPVPEEALRHLHSAHRYPSPYQYRILL